METKIVFPIERQLLQGELLSDREILLSDSKLRRYVKNCYKNIHPIHGNGEDFMRGHFTKDTHNFTGKEGFYRRLEQSPFYWKRGTLSAFPTLCRSVQ